MVYNVDKKKCLKSYNKIYYRKNKNVSKLYVSTLYKQRETRIKI